MVEVVRKIIFLCWVCSSLNFQDLGLSNYGQQGFKYYKYIYTNLQHSQLGIEDLEMLISIYENWPNDAHESMKQFMEMKNDIMEENEELIDKTELLKLGEMF
jgi:hypothetical protein